MRAKIDRQTIGKSDDKEAFEYGYNPVMELVLNVYKPVGKTPLEMIQAVREKWPPYRDVKISYAGRLDPLAHGVLLLLVEPETKKSREYYQLAKTYEFEAVFGLASDSHDVLGLASVARTGVEPEAVEALVPDLIGKQIQPFPAYSSAVVDGKPLFAWAREGRLAEILIPKKEIEIYDLLLKETRTIASAQLQEQVEARIGLIKGDFRQQEILANWQLILEKDRQFPVVRMSVSCSSGTYVRGLVDRMGKLLHSGALALDILRTKVGPYSLRDSITL
jgi:tRNA pseudouridine55 synthase